MASNLALRVVARFLEAARPIPIDKRRTMELAKEIERAIAMKTHGLHGPLGNRVLIPAAPYDIANVKGETVELLLHVQAVETKSPLFVVWGGLGTHNGRRVIVVKFNGSLDAEAIHKSAMAGGIISKQLYSLLIHELTHAADIGEGVGAKLPTEEAARANPETYYNDPTEVRAYMQEIVDELEFLFEHHEKFAEMFGSYGKAIDVLMKQSQTWLDIEKHLTESNKHLITKGVVRALHDWQDAHKTASVFASRVAARYKQKIKTDEGNTVYTYSERQVANRNKKKAERIEKLRKSIGKLRAKVKKDLHAQDPEKTLLALAVALMDETYERVGNEESAKDGHVGVTGWCRKHVSFGPKSAVIRYVGKSGVKHEKRITDPAIRTALRDAYDAHEDDDDEILSWDGGRVTAQKVNDYLAKFDITAKDIRGFHANALMQDALRKARKDGGKLPKDPKKAKEKLKAEFKSALEEAAEAVGHEPSTLKSQYLVPGLEETYLKDGTVIDKLSSSVDGETTVRPPSRFPTYVTFSYPCLG
jgi:DNA topoisomerase IB